MTKTKKPAKTPSIYLTTDRAAILTELRDRGPMTRADLEMIVGKSLGYTLALMRKRGLAHLSLDGLEYRWSITSAGRRALQPKLKHTYSTPRWIGAEGEALAVVRGHDRPISEWWALMESVDLPLSRVETWARTMPCADPDVGHLVETGEVTKASKRSWPATVYEAPAKALGGTSAPAYMRAFYEALEVYRAGDVKGATAKIEALLKGDVGEGR